METHPKRKRKCRISLHVNLSRCPRMFPLRNSEMERWSTFLRRATALKICLGTSISEAGIARVEVLHRIFDTSLDDVRVVHILSLFHTVICLIISVLWHWRHKTQPSLGIHLPNQPRDFGPVYGFCTFLGERLKNLLKTFNNNSRKSGQLEVSMMRSFGHDLISGPWSVYLLHCFTFINTA